MLVNPQPQSDLTPRISNEPAKAIIWAFFKSNPDRVIVKVAFIKVRVRDLRVLFELLAGPEPE